MSVRTADPVEDDTLAFGKTAVEPNTLPVPHTRQSWPCRTLKRGGKPPKRAHGRPSSRKIMIFAHPGPSAGPPIAPRPLGPGPKHGHPCNRRAHWGVACSARIPSLRRTPHPDSKPKTAPRATGGPRAIPLQCRGQALGLGGSTDGWVDRRERVATLGQ